MAEASVSPHSKPMRFTARACLQAMSEKQEILDLPQENQDEMDLLAGLYNQHRNISTKACQADPRSRAASSVCLPSTCPLRIQARYYSVVKLTNMTDGSSRAASHIDRESSMEGGTKHRAETSARFKHTGRYGMFCDSPCCSHSQNYWNHNKAMARTTKQITGESLLM